MVLLHYGYFITIEKSEGSIVTEIEHSPEGISRLAHLNTGPFLLSGPKKRKIKGGGMSSESGRPSLPNMSVRRTPEGGNRKNI